MRTDPLIEAKLIHDMNSGLGSLGQAMELLSDKNNRSEELVDEIAPLSLKKIQNLIETWSQITQKLN